MRAFLALLEKELLQILRSREILPLILLVPVLQLIILGNAATFEVKLARLAVVDQDQSEASRELVRRFAATGRFLPVAHPPDLARAHEELATGRARMILAIPRGFERDLERERRGRLQLVFDAVDGSTAGILSAYSSAILARYERELGVSVLGAPRGGTAAPAVAYWFNEELSYRSYMIPGILAELVTVVGLLLCALNIVREKEIGTIEQLNVTPMSKSAFIAAKLVPFWLLGLAELTVGLLVARYLFEVPMRGSIPLVFASAALYLLVMLAIGLWISTLSSTQQQATFLSLFVLLVFILLSGLFTPVESMPGWAQAITRANPIYHLVEVMRSVLLKGTGLATIGHHLVAMAAMVATVLPLAVWRYRKTAE
jgi:ABC-2 type transport system permease protein